MPFNVSGVFSRLYSWVTDRDTGVKINAPRMDAEFDGIATAINAIVGQTQPFIAQIKTVAGTASAPAIAPDGDANTGVYFPAADQVAVAVNGAQAALYTSTGATFAYPFFAPAGSASAPSISVAGDTNTGMYFPAADQVALTTNGTQRVLLSTSALTSTVPLRAALGSATSPAYSFSSYTNTGIYGTSVGVVVSALGNAVANFNSTSCYFIQPVVGEGAVTVPLLARSVGGTANAITLTVFDTATFGVGAQVAFMASASNTGATTLNVDGSGAKNCVTPTGAALPSGYIRTDTITRARYNGTNWVVDREPEYGSNANGEYWRYADGRQVCTKTVSSLGPVSTALGSIFQSGNISLGTWAAAFAATPTMPPPLVHSAANAHAWWAQVQAPSTTGAGVGNILRGTTSAATDFVAYAKAEGRWY